MAAFTGRNWYLAGLTIAAGAIASQLLSKHYAGLAMMSMAQSAEALCYQQAIRPQRPGNLDEG